MVAVGLGGLALALVAVVRADPFVVDARALGILFLLGGIAGPTGRIWIANARRYLNTAQVSLFTPVETVAATMWAWLFLSETPTPATFAGGAVVLGAVLYGTLPDSRALSDVAKA